MLKISTSVAILRELSIRMPKDGGSGFDKHVIRIRFKIVDKDHQDEMQRRLTETIRREEDESDEAYLARLEAQREWLRQYDRDLLREAIVDWPADKTSGLADDEGDPLPYNEETRDALLNNPIILAQLVAYYRDLLSGKAGIGKN